MVTALTHISSKSICFMIVVHMQLLDPATACTRRALRRSRMVLQKRHCNSSQLSLALFTHIVHVPVARRKVMHPCPATVAARQFSMTFFAVWHERFLNIDQQFRLAHLNASLAKQGWSAKSKLLPICTIANYDQS